MSDASHATRIEYSCGTIWNAVDGLAKLADELVLPAIDQVEPTVKEIKPDVLVSCRWCCFNPLSTAEVGNVQVLMRCQQFCASMWTPEESARIQQIAKDIVPGIKTHAIPQGLQVEKGPDAVVEYLKEQIPGLLG